MPTAPATQSGPTILLRALGLGIANYILSLIGHKKFEEPPKIALRRSRKTALARNIIHLVPIIGAVTVISLNCAGFYVGASLENINALQFAAKLHEMTMVASLAQILVSTIRDELLCEQGLPWGALFSGLQISQLSYLWSMEFWGSVTTPSLPLWKKCRLLGTIIICVLLAATVGPSSAIAMIPRVGYWPAGSTHIWLNGTHQDLNPSAVNTLNIPRSCLNTSRLPIPDHCPSSGWQSIGSVIPSFRNVFGPEGSNWASIELLDDGSEGLRSIQLDGQDALRSLETCVGCQYGLATAPVGAVASALSLIATVWSNSMGTDPVFSAAGRLSSYRNAIHSVESLQPFVTVSYPTPGAANGPEDTGPVTFSLKSDIDCVIGSVNSINVTSITRAQLISTGDPRQPRLVFVDLPQPGTNITNLGAIFLDPRDPGNMTQLYSTCIITAAWSTLKMNTTGSTGTTLGSVIESPGLQTLYPAVERRCQDLGSPLPGLISLSKQWAEFSNPFIPEVNTTVYSALSSLVHGSAEDGTVLDFQGFLVTTLITNSLSNIGSNLSLQGNVSIVEFPDIIGVNRVIDGRRWILHGEDLFDVTSHEGESWVKLRVDSVIEGLAYTAEGLAVRIAIAVLTLYCVFAIPHVVFTSVRGISSSSWDSIAELTALAMNSPPTKELRNTCAGIASVQTFRTVVSVVARHEKGKSTATGDGHLQLVLGADRIRGDGDAIRLDAAYGALGDNECGVGHAASMKIPLRRVRRRCSV